MKLPAMCTENYDPCYPDQPVVDRYLPVWAKLPAFAAKPAFIWADDDAASSRTALTYSQLDSAVESMARNLLGTLRRGDAVLVLASPGLRLVKLLFACQRAGLTAVPVIPPDPARFGPAHAHLLRAVSQTRPSAAVADARYIDAVTRTAAAAAGGESGRLAAMLRSLRWLAVGELERERGSGGPGSAAGYVGCGPDDVYLIQYTSGTTGVPKPVVGHRGLGGPQRAGREEGLLPVPRQRRRVVAAAVPRLRAHVPAPRRRRRRHVRAGRPRRLRPAAPALARARRRVQGDVHARPVVRAAAGAPARPLGGARPPAA